MKWRYYALRDGDPKALEVIFNNLALGAYEHSLSRKLVARFLGAEGPVIAIAQESLDLHNLRDYSSATYNSGQRWYEAAGARTATIGDRSIDGLISFLLNYLALSQDSVVVIEHSVAERSKRYLNTDIQFESTDHDSFFNEEVYEVLRPKDTDPEFIEDVIRDAWHYYFIGLCASGIKIPQVRDWTDDFLNELVVKTHHIFAPAFDDEGFLVWSPKTVNCPVQKGCETEIVETDGPHGGTEPS